MTYHSTHQSWPVHAAPNDFWRFSDEALKVLFGEATGFEIVRAGFQYPVRLYPDRLRPADVKMPVSAAAWGGSYIYARKVAEVAESAVAWPTDCDRSRRIAQSYPVV